MAWSHGISDSLFALTLQSHPFGNAEGAAQLGQPLNQRPSRVCVLWSNTLVSVELVQVGRRERALVLVLVDHTDDGL